MEINIIKTRTMVGRKTTPTPRVNIIIMLEWLIYRADRQNGLFRRTLKSALKTGDVKKS